MREITRRTALGGADAVALGSAGALPARAEQLRTRQTVVLPDRGWWTVSVWAKSGGALNAGTLSVRSESAVVAQTEQDDKWVRSAVSVSADRRQQCTVDLITARTEGAWATFSEVSVSSRCHGGLRPGRERDQPRHALAVGTDLGRRPVR
jgi:hypothetical protein